MHIHAPLQCIVRGCLLLFPRNESLKHDVVCRVTALPSFMFVSALVSELRKSKQNKEKEEEEETKNSEIGYFQFNTFPGYTIF